MEESIKGIHCDVLLSFSGQIRENRANISRSSGLKSDAVPNTVWDF
jgi:hypothetical protein